MSQIDEVSLSETSEAVAPTAKQPRGFALMSVERQREIASLGGKTAHESGRAHQFSSEEGRSAGQKGGFSVSRDREYMRRLGKKGGEARARKERLGPSRNMRPSTLRQAQGSGRTEKDHSSERSAAESKDYFDWLRRTATPFPL